MTSDAMRETLLCAQTPEQVLTNSAAIYPDHDALYIPSSACAHYSDAPIALTYRMLKAAVDAQTDIWAATGITGRVALVLENRPAFFIHWLALNALGISVIPLNHEMPDEEFPYYLEHGEAHAVVVLREHYDRLIDISRLMSTSVTVVADDAVAEHAFGTACSPIDADPARECALLYTSGSTGKPKACVLSNDYFIQQGRWYRALDGHISLREGQERLLTPLPLSHMNAMSVSTMAMFMTGGCLIQLDRFHPTTWWQSVRESQATALHYLGVLPAILLALPACDSDDLSNQVRFGFGAGVNPAHHERFEQRFGFPLIEAWAMTECGAGGAIIANREPRHVGQCCFGKPGPDVEWQLVDEQKAIVPAGTPGELRVRAHGTDPRKGYFSGYLKNPEATAEIWLEGWLNTGDVAVELEDGSLAFVDRRKNIIRRSGENISALEVEAALGDHIAIEAAVATPVPDEMRGDEVAVCIVLKKGYPDNDDTAMNIQAHALNKLIYFKAPGWLVFCDTLPVTASNKPKRGDIKVLARDSVVAGKAVDLRHLKKRRGVS